MGIGKRLRFFRHLRGLTLKELGILSGFNPKNADTRVAQYERERAMPCDDIINRFAESLHVDIHALKVPNLSTPAEIMHMLFLLEDIITNNNNEELSIMINRWVSMSKKLKEGKITKRTYDEWRYIFK